MFIVLKNKIYKSSLISFKNDLLNLNNPNIKENTNNIEVKKIKDYNSFLNLLKAGQVEEFSLINLNDTGKANPNNFSHYRIFFKTINKQKGKLDIGSLSEQEIQNLRALAQEYNVKMLFPKPQNVEGIYGFLKSALIFITSGIIPIFTFKVFKGLSYNNFRNNLKKEIYLSTEKFPAEGHIKRGEIENTLYGIKAIHSSYNRVIDFIEEVEKNGIDSKSFGKDKRGNFAVIGMPGIGKTETMMELEREKLLAFNGKNGKPRYVAIRLQEAIKEVSGFYKHIGTILGDSPRQRAEIIYKMLADTNADIAGIIVDDPQENSSYATKIMKELFDIHKEALKINKNLKKKVINPRNLKFITFSLSGNTDPAGSFESESRAINERIGFTRVSSKNITVQERMVLIRGLLKDFYKLNPFDIPSELIGLLGGIEGIAKVKRSTGFNQFEEKEVKVICSPREYLGLLSDMKSLIPVNSPEQNVNALKEWSNALVKAYKKSKDMNKKEKRLVENTLTQLERELRIPSQEILENMGKAMEALLDGSINI